MATDNKYRYSEAYFKIRDLILNNPNENVFVIKGGQGASKTISILELIIQALVSSEKEATVLSSELSKMKRTVIRDYNKICKDWGITNMTDEFNKSESKHEYSNGSYIDFMGADVSDIGKGFRRNILYINEADKMDMETAIQFISRADLTIIDYNPDDIFWGDDFIKENNTLTLTYQDNEFLSPSEIKSILEYREKGFYNIELPIEELFKESNIKSKYWANKWRVYGLGLIGMLDGVVFDDFNTVDNIPHGAEFIAGGMDFGFTNDPTTLIECYRYNGELYLNELIFSTGLTNQDIGNKLTALNWSKQRQIVADSAEPKSIEELRRMNFNIQPAQKGADSIRASIDILKRFKINITNNSVNLKKEFMNYIWSEKDNSQPVDCFNHGIDAVRYIALNKLANKNSGSYSFA